VSWLPHFWYWVEVHTGTVNEAGPYYGFFSGFGSDIAELAILGGVIQFARHANCHTKGCWRFGKPLEGTAYRLCHHCHPGHKGTKRNVPLTAILEAHENRIRR
jgi:hypothetical protein